MAKSRTRLILDDHTWDPLKKNHRNTTLLLAKNKKHWCHIRSAEGCFFYDKRVQKGESEEKHLIKIEIDEKKLIELQKALELENVSLKMDETSKCLFENLSLKQLNILASYVNHPCSNPWF